MAEKQRASHSFVVRIWRESGLVRPAGRPLWRGRVQHAASGEYRVFESLDGLLDFIQSQTGVLENNKLNRQTARNAKGTANTQKNGEEKQ